MKHLFPALVVAFSAVSGLDAAPVPTAATLASTYLGGGGAGYATDTAFAVATGGDGAVYVLGQTSSDPFPQTTAIGGSTNGYGSFVVKLSADGKTRLYSTFLTGVSGRALAVDGAGSVYVTGETGGSLPGTSSAQAKFGGSYDAFVLKLRPDGKSLAYATYLGGRELDLGRGIAVDPDGNAYVAGWTTSTDFPVTPGAAQPVNGGGHDAFIAKLDPTGTQFVFATYLGGAGFESGAALALDPQRRVVVVGRTGSTNFLGVANPTRFGSDKRSFDAYVARLRADGKGVDYLTLIAGEAYDTAARVAIAADGGPVVMGHTESVELPVTPGVYQPAYRGSRDLFVAKLTPAGDRLVFCTYLGTAGFDSVGDAQYAGGYHVGEEFVDGTSLLTESGGLALDAAGDVLVVGSTGADAWPDASATGRGGFEVFAAKLSAAGDRLRALNFIGGRADDVAHGAAADGLGGIWIVGESSRPVAFAPYLTTTSGAAQERFGGGISDAFATHLGLAPPVPLNDSFGARLPLTGTRLTTVVRTDGASKESGEPAHAGQAGGASVWWTWTAPADGRLIADTAGSRFDTLLAVYQGTTIGALVPVAADDDVAAGSTTSRVKFAVAKDTTYVFAVDGKGAATGDLVLSLTFSRPTNDDFADRIVLKGFPVTAAGSNVDATAENLNDTSKAGLPGGQPVWWEWTSPTNGIVAVSTAGSSFDTSLAVFTGTSLDDLTEVRSNDNSGQPGSGGTSQVIFPATAGTRYLIAVDGYYAATGTIQLGIFPGDPPANDNFADRSVLTGFFASATTSTLNATTETSAGEKLLAVTNRSGNLDLSSAGYSVWWTWTAPTNGQAEIFTSDVAFDTRLGVFTGSTLGQLTLVASNDNDPRATAFTPESRLLFQVETGTTYQIEVDGDLYNGHSGRFTLNLRLLRPPTVVDGSTEVLPDGAVRFQVQGLPGVTYQVERTTDLKAWSPVTQLTPGTEFFAVTDPAGPGSAQRFYRLTALP